MLWAFARRYAAPLLAPLRHQLWHLRPPTPERRRDLPIYAVWTRKRQLALTFDAGHGNEDAAQILAILRCHRVRATYFVTGDWVRAYPDDTLAILAAGHELGNHSDSHSHMTRISDADKRAEITLLHDAVRRLTGHDMSLFRAPYGDYDDAVVQAARACGYTTVQWNVDSLDWMNRGAADIVRTVTQHQRLRNGSIVLLHVGTRFTAEAEALDTLIVELKQQRFQLVPVSELILRENYYLAVDGTQVPLRWRPS